MAVRGTDWLYVTGSTKATVNLANTKAQNTGYGTDTIKGIEHISGARGPTSLRVQLVITPSKAITAMIPFKVRMGMTVSMAGTTTISFMVGQVTIVFIWMQAMTF